MSLAPNDPWLRLYQDHRRLRAEDVVSLETEVRPRLMKLAKLHSDEWLGYGWRAKGADVLSVYELKEMPLRKVEGFASLTLTMFATVNRRDLHVEKFTVMLEARTADARDWAAAIHLEGAPFKKPEGDHKGDGACGHAALHCHVGPGLGVHPKVRVPLPAMPMAQCLDWLLTTVIPMWEPAPWPSIAAALEPSESGAQ